MYVHVWYNNAGNNIDAELRMGNECHDAEYEDDDDYDEESCIGKLLYSIQFFEIVIKHYVYAI